MFVFSEIFSATKQKYNLQWMVEILGISLVHMGEEPW